MRNWFRRLFSSSTPPVGPPSTDASQSGVVGNASDAWYQPASASHRTPAATEGFLSPEQVAFLEGLAYPPEPRHIEDFPRDDRFFLGGIVKRLHARELEMPVLPEIALRVSEMLRHGELPVAQYVALVNKDPALSIEVLKTANSAFYGGATRSANLHEAVIRVGLARLQAILMIAHLKSKVLKGASFFGKADLLLEMSLPMAFLGSKLATNRRTQPDLCFTRGMLMHVEHLVIFGTIADISREHRHAISPSVAAMHQAFDLYGPEIRHAVASSWKLTDILIGEKNQNDFALEYTGLRQALVCRWLNRPLPELPRVDAEHLVETMTHIHPRVEY